MKENKNKEGGVMIGEVIEVMNSGPLGDFFLSDDEVLTIKENLKEVINNYKDEEGDIVKLACAMFVCSDVSLEKLMEGLDKDRVKKMLRNEYVRQVEWLSDENGRDFENYDEYNLNPLSNMYFVIQEIGGEKRNMVFDENKIFEIVRKYKEEDIKERMDKEDEKLLVEDGSLLYPYLKYLKRIGRLEEFIKEWGKDILNKKLEVIDKKVEEV
jgi:hypothetical protein